MLLVNGYVYRFKDILGTSHRHLKDDLEATKVDDGTGLVHLCASSTCTLPSDARRMVPVCSSGSCTAAAS